jgi:hypothetical protein
MEYTGDQEVLALKLNVTHGSISKCCDTTKKEHIF